MKMSLNLKAIKATFLVNWTLILIQFKFFGKSGKSTMWLLRRLLCSYRREIYFVVCLSVVRSCFIMPFSACRVSHSFAVYGAKNALRFMSPGSLFFLTFHLQHVGRRQLSCSNTVIPTSDRVAATHVPTSLFEFQLLCFKASVFSIDAACKSLTLESLFNLFLFLFKDYYFFFSLNPINRWIQQFFKYWLYAKMSVLTKSPIN